VYLALGGAATAQVDTGSIDGRVFDQQGAAAPGVTVTAKNVGTGLARTSTTGAEGTYHLAPLPAGVYDVSAELSGFSTQTHKGVVVNIGRSTAVDITIKLGGVSETVNVTGETPLIQTTT
jgi:hypothetical protein